MCRGVDSVVGEVTGWSNVTEHLNENFLADSVDAILTKHPNVQFAYYTRTADTTQLTFYTLMGGMIDAGATEENKMKMWNRQNLAMLEGLAAKHSNFRTFVASGEGHCSMTFDSAMTVPGFEVWLEDILTNSSSAANTTAATSKHVNCGATCTLAGVTGCDGTQGSKKLTDRCGKCGGDGSSCPVLQHTVAAGTCPPKPMVKKESKDIADEPSGAATTSRGAGVGMGWVVSCALPAMLWASRTQ